MSDRARSARRSARKDVCREGLWALCPVAEVRHIPSRLGVILGFRKEPLPTKAPMKLQLAAQCLQQLPTPTDDAASVTEIDAGFNEIRSIPPSIARYRNLQALHLNRNLLEDLPDELVALTELRVLNLSCNPLRGVPRVLTRMPNLTVLHLDRTELAEIRPDFQPAGLDHLSLSLNSISSLPEELFANAKSLRILRLSRNRLETLPASLGSLAVLWELDLSQNDLQALPEELGQLRRLQTLHLQGNRLRSLPKSMGQLKSLRELIVHENQLDVLPDSIGQLDALDWLDASHNVLASLPGGIGGWTAMRHLVLSSNQLGSLPAGICRLPSLERCFLQDNHLSDLLADASAKGLPALKSVYISGNRFADDWAPPAPFRKAVCKDEHGHTL